jgi:L-aspartate oxidase
MAELAPRDVVSREIESVMARCDRNNVWLDARHLGEEYLRTRFPTIWDACSEAGYNLSRDLLPVAPAAHYLVGGVLVDIDGRSSLPGLYAAGEVTASGLHGANRLASNSLLEGLVFSRRIARALNGSCAAAPVRHISATHGRGFSAGGNVAEDYGIVSAAVKEVMQRHVGMSRSDEGLARAAAELEALGATLGGLDDSAAQLEVANLVTVGTLIAHAAWLRTESRGCHFRRDYPEREEAWRVRIVQQVGQAPSHALVGGHMMLWARSGGTPAETTTTSLTASSEDE